jgi:HD-GYP domain-containing protein (c-di-GMP phosphodiesterase class II)
MADAEQKPVRGSREPESTRIETLGPRLLTRLAALVRTARTHDVSNQAFQRQLQGCLGVIQELLEEEHEVALVAVADHFFINGVRVKATAGLLPVVHAMLGEFERRALGGVQFFEGVNAAELERFFQLFMAADDPAVAGGLFQAIEAASVSHIAPLATVGSNDDELLRRVEEQKNSASERGRAKKVFWRAVLGTRHILTRAAQNGRPDLRHAKRLVQPVVDSIMKHEYSLVGLTALKDHDEYTYAHCVNVSILSVSMGHALSLSRQTLADLGVAALLHDLGKIAIPAEVLSKPAKLDAREWQLMRRHPLEGTKMLFRMPGLSVVGLDSMRVSLEHHMNVDRTGYPEIQGEWGQSALSRIVALADCFDAMTAHRAYHRRAFSPFEALQYVLGPGRTPFDRAALWSLVRTVGLYPPGTVVLTGSGCMVLSLSPNPDDLARPHCRVLVHPDGRVEPEEGGETWSPMPPDEQITRVLRPEDLSLNTGEYLAA